MSLSAGADKSVSRYAFGPFELDAAQHVLYREGLIVALPPKAADILAVLVRRAGEVVSREFILEQVWEGAYVEDTNLTKNISLLRAALREHSGDADVVRTVPKRGYQFVGEVREVLEEPAPVAEPMARAEEITAAEPERANHPVPVQPPLAIIRSNRSWLVAVTVAVLLSVSLSAYGWLRYQASRVAASRPSVAILSLRDLGVAGEDGWLDASLRQALGASLTSDGGARMISTDRISLAEQDLALLETRSYDDKLVQAVGRRLACGFVVTGSYLVEGDRVRLDLQLRDTASGAVVKTVSQTASGDQLSSMMAQATADLRKAIGVAPAASADFFLPTLREGRSSSFRHYVQGQRAFRAGKLQEAETLLSQAIAEAPAMSMAHSALASTWQAMGYAERAEQEARLAMKTASSSLKEEDRLVLQANAYATFDDWPNAIGAYTRLWHDHPDDFDYVLALADCLNKSGKPKQALELAESVTSRSKAAADDPRFAMSMAASSMLMGEWRGQLLHAGDQIRLARASGSPYLESRGFMAEANAWIRLGDPARGMADYREAEQISTRIGDQSGIANVLTAHGAELGYRKEPGAMEMLQRAIHVYQEIGNRTGIVNALSELGCAQTYIEDWAGAKQSFHAAVDLARELHRPSIAIGAMLDLVYVASNEDDLASQETYANESLKVAEAASNLDGVSSAYLDLGDFAFQKGDLAQAKSRYDQALAIEQKIDGGYAIGKLKTHMAILAMAAGDLAEARRLHDEITAMHVLRGERLESQMVAEAALSIEEGHCDRVIPAMTDLAQKATNAHPGAEAWRLVAKCNLQHGDIAGARNAIQKSLVFARNSRNTTDYLIPDSLMEAQIEAASGSVAKAATQVNQLLHHAEHIGNRRLQLEVRLVAGQIERKHGSADRGERTLKAVVIDARQKGFGLIQRMAASYEAEATTVQSRPPLAGHGAKSTNVAEESGTRQARRRTLSGI